LWSHLDAVIEIRENLGTITGKAKITSFKIVKLFERPLLGRVLVVVLVMVTGLVVLVVMTLVVVLGLVLAPASLVVLGLVLVPVFMTVVGRMVMFLVMGTKNR
jgi:hypothetical protein